MQKKASQILLEREEAWGAGSGKKQGVYAIYLPAASFSVLPLSTRAKPLICINPGTAAAPYVTVLLRGGAGGTGALNKVKAVVLFATYAAVTMSTEASLLSDVGAMLPPSPPPSVYPFLLEPAGSARVDGGVESGGLFPGEERESEGNWVEPQMVAEEPGSHVAWRLVGLSPWISHPLPVDVSQQLVALYCKSPLTGRAQGSHHVRDDPHGAGGEAVYAYLHIYVYTYTYRYIYR